MLLVLPIRQPVIWAHQRHVVSSASDQQANGGRDSSVVVPAYLPVIAVDEDADVCFSLTLIIMSVITVFSMSAVVVLHNSFSMWGHLMSPLGVVYVVVMGTILRLVTNSLMAAIASFILAATLISVLIAEAVGGVERSGIVQSLVLGLTTTSILLEFSIILVINCVHAHDWGLVTEFFACHFFFELDLPSDVVGLAYRLRSLGVVSSAIV